MVASRCRLLSNFALMAVCFSVNHGAVTSVLSLAVPLLGPVAGPYSSGTLYICYAATALFLSTPIMSFLGTRNALIVGTALYCVYVASFPVGLFATSGHSDGWCTEKSAPDADCADPHNVPLVIIAIAGGVVGGFAAGFLWSAQGAYFSSTAKLYAAASKEAEEVAAGQLVEESEEDAAVHDTERVTKATGTLASIFACIFLSCEVLLKLLAFALKTIEVNDFKLGNLFVTIVYSGLALCSVAGLFFVADLDKNGPLARLIARWRAQRAGAASESALLTESNNAEATEEESCGAPCFRAFLAKAAASAALWCKHPKVLLLNPIQIAFGCCAALLGYEVSGVAIGAAFGTNAVQVVGLMSAATAATAALLQLPFAFVARRVGKPPLMLLGLSAFVALASICLAATTEQLGTWALIVPCYLLQGIGRASYEGTNRAVCVLRVCAAAAPSPPRMLRASTSHGAVLTSPSPPPSVSLSLPPGHRDLYSFVALNILLFALSAATSSLSRCNGATRSYADFFPNDAPAAFSNIVLANGVASAAAYFVFPHLPRVAMASVALVAALVAIVGYIAAVAVNKWCAGREEEKGAAAPPPMH